MNNPQDIDEREYDRGMLRSEFVSLFWSVISDLKNQEGGFTLQKLADKLGVNKSQVSRWFNGTPNWELDTVADIANALGVDLQIVARDRSRGRIFTPSGQCSTRVSTSYNANVQTFRSKGSSATGTIKRDYLNITQVAA